MYVHKKFCLYQLGYFYNIYVHMYYTYVFSQKSDSVSIFEYFHTYTHMYVYTKISHLVIRSTYRLPKEFENLRQIIRSYIHMYVHTYTHKIYIYVSACICRYEILLYLFLRQ